MIESTTDVESISRARERLAAGRFGITTHARERIVQRLTPVVGKRTQAYPWVRAAIQDAAANDALSDVPPGWIDGRRLPRRGRAGGIWIAAACKGVPVAILLTAKGHPTLVTVIVNGAEDGDDV